MSKKLSQRNYFTKENIGDIFSNYLRSQEIQGTDPRVESLIESRNELLRQQFGPTDEPDPRVENLMNMRNELLGKEGLEGGEQPDMGGTESPISGAEGTLPPGELP